MLTVEIRFPLKSAPMTFRRRSLPILVSSLALGALIVAGVTTDGQAGVRDQDQSRADTPSRAEEVPAGPNEFTVPTSDTGLKPGQSFENMMRYAEHAQRQGNLVLAARLFGSAHEARPLELAPLRALIAISRALDRPASAAIYYQRAVALDPDDLQMVADYGTILLVLNQPREARIQFNQALALAESPRYYTGIGLTFDMVGDHDAAQPYYLAALELDPTNLTARSNLGLSLALGGDHERAIALLEAAVENPAAKAQHHRLLATAYALAGDLAQAQAVGGADFAEGALAATLADITGRPSAVAATTANQP